MMQNNVLLLIAAAVFIIVLTILSSRKKCQECPTVPGVLDGFLETVPSNATDMITGRTIGIPNVQNVTSPCPIRTQANTSTEKNIEMGQYGQLFKNKNTATKSQYPYVFRPYKDDTIGQLLDTTPNYAARGAFISQGLCDTSLKPRTVYGNTLECKTKSDCSYGKTCKLDGDDNTNNLCV